MGKEEIDYMSKMVELGNKLGGVLLEAMQEVGIKDIPEPKAFSVGYDYDEKEIVIKLKLKSEDKRCNK